LLKCRDVSATILLNKRKHIYMKVNAYILYDHDYFVNTNAKAT
jgi:hypothetical protein